MKRGRRGGKKKGHELLPELAMPTQSVPRRLRVENDVLRELLTALSGMSDQRLATITITRVQMTEDLRNVKVYARPSSVAEIKVSPDRMLDALKVARGRLRRHLATTLGLRFTPELRFLFDDGPDAARRVDALLDEIAQEGASSADSHDSLESEQASVSAADADPEQDADRD